MVVWSDRDASAQRVMIARATASESLDILSDAKSWGFRHGVRQPRPLVVATTPPRS